MYAFRNILVGRFVSSFVTIVQALLIWGKDGRVLDILGDNYFMNRIY